jgi:hypothetical protein
MIFRLKNKFFHIMLLVGVTFFLASVAEASPSHNQHGKTDVVSPFDQFDNEGLLHCDLNGHNHYQITHCPHYAHGKKNDQTMLRSDCGSQPISANPSSLFFEYFYVNVTHFGLTPTQLSSTIKISLASKTQQHLRYIDRPPSHFS